MLRKALSTFVLTNTIMWNNIALGNLSYNAQPHKLENRKGSLLGLVDFINLSFTEQYAPYEWKKRLLHWNWKKETENIKNEIRSDTTTEEFHQLLRKLLATMQDSHVNIRFSPRKSARLPVDVLCLNNRMIISHTSSGSKSIRTKDEILTINGTDALKVYQDFLIACFGAKNYIPRFAWRQFANFTNRKNSHADPFPEQHNWILKVKNEKEDLSEISLQWIITDEEDEEDRYQHFCRPTSSTQNLILSYGGKSLISNYSPGSYEPFIPTLGTVVWRYPEIPSDGIYSYIFLSGSTKIGFMRIGNYMNLNTCNLSSVISKMESETEALIIDLTNNTGGFLDLGLQSLAMLSSNTLQLPKFSINLDSEMISEACRRVEKLKSLQPGKETIDCVPPHIFYSASESEKTNTTKNTSTFYTKIVEDWSSGIITTAPLYYIGLDKVYPYKVHYSKPLIVVVNESSSSCTEFVVATLQDNKRATVVGSKTTGAGGFVKECTAANIHGVSKWFITSSVLVRQNGLPIESLGITPDIRYDIDINEIITNFEHLKNVLTQSAERAIIVNKRSTTSTHNARNRYRAIYK